MDKKNLQLIKVSLGEPLYEVRLDNITIFRSRTEAEAIFYFDNYSPEVNKEELLKSKLV